MFDAVAERVIERVPYGWLVRIGVLLFLITLFLCRGTYGMWDIDSHIIEFNDEPVIVTAGGGYLSNDIATNIWSTNNGMWHLITSNSSVQEDIIVKANDGLILYTYKGLLPGRSIYFEADVACCITFSAS
jgi:hypothetical protein